MFGMGQPHGDHVVRPVSDEMFRELPRRRGLRAIDTTRREPNGEREEPR